MKSTDRQIYQSIYLSLIVVTTIITLCSSVQSMLVQHRCRAIGHSDVRVDVIVELLLLEILPAVAVAVMVVVGVVRGGSSDSKKERW